MCFFQNPLPYLARYPDADILTSSDQVVPTVVDDRLDIWQQGTVFNNNLWFLQVCSLHNLNLMHLTIETVSVCMMCSFVKNTHKYHAYMVSQLSFCLIEVYKAFSNNTITL